MKRTVNYTIRHLINPEITMIRALIAIGGIIILVGAVGGFVILVVVTHLFYR